LPRIERFAALSPLPGFKYGTPGTQQGRRACWRAGLQRLQESDWHQHAELAERLQPVLLQLAAFYLFEAKKDGEPLDGVARFHLGNGARIERLNWLADISEQGMRRSAGVMVNYEYRLSDLEENHEAFAREHRVIASADVRRLARGARDTLIPQDQQSSRKDGKRKRKDAKAD
jgi:malonyl-CoA decarboxylase